MVRSKFLGHGGGGGGPLRPAVPSARGGPSMLQSSVLRGCRRSSDPVRDPVHGDLFLFCLECWSPRGGVSSVVLGASAVVLVTRRGPRCWHTVFPTKAAVIRTPPHLSWSLWVGCSPREQPGLRRGFCAVLSSQLGPCWCGRSTSSSRRARTRSRWKAPRRTSAWPRSRSRPWSRTW